MLDEAKKFNEMSDKVFDFALHHKFENRKLERYFLRSIGYDLGELSKIFYQKFIDQEEDYYKNYSHFIENMYKKIQLYQKLGPSNAHINLLINEFQHIDEKFCAPLSAQEQAEHFLSLQQSYYQQLKSDAFDDISYIKIDEESAINIFKK